MASSSHLPVLPIEIWNMVGQFSSNQTLFALVRVSRENRSIFEPLLYNFIHIRLGAHVRRDERTGGPVPSWMRFVKHMLVSVDFGMKDPRFRYEPCCNRVQEKIKVGVSLIIKFLDNTVGLKKIRLCNASNYRKCQYSPSLILEHPTLLDHLKNYPGLECFSVFSTRELPTDYPINWSPSFPYRGFQNLVSLQLLSLRGDTNAGILGDLVEVLSSSPGLKILGLGLAIHNVLAIHVPTSEWKENITFMALCLAYGRKKGAPPLSLKSLFLGFGMMFLDPQLRSDWRTDYPMLPQNIDRRYLARMIDPLHLETIHMYNRDVIGRSQLQNDPIYWSFFTSDECPKLCRLYVNIFRPFNSNNMFVWLASSSIITELVITDDIHEGLEPREHPLLALDPSFKVPNLSIFYYPHSFNLTQMYEVGRERLFQFAAGLGSTLTALAIHLDFRDQWEMFERGIRHLRRITQLFLVHYPSVRGPMRISPLGPERALKENCLYYAQKIVNKSQTLEYIQIDRFTWRIYRKTALGGEVEGTSAKLHGPITQEWHCIHGERAEEEWRLSERVELPCKLEEMDVWEKHEVYLLNTQKRIYTSVLAPTWDARGWPELIVM